LTSLGCDDLGWTAQALVNTVMQVDEVHDEVSDQQLLKKNSA
jgi:hypothetical protein